MGDGRLGKCKECTKKDSKTRSQGLRKDPDWVKKEQIRGREKYRRLCRTSLKPYKQKLNDGTAFLDRYPEKKKARSISSHMRGKDGFNLHHWSYRNEHFLDVIELSVVDHYKVHRFMVYDQERMQYRKLDGTLLDSKESAEAFYREILHNS